MDVTAWLLEGDPAIRWQVLRDLVAASPDEVEAERARVEHEGWGAALLALEDPDGLWAGGACFPGDYDWNNRPPGQPWTATMHTLQTLQLLGLDPQSESARRAIALITENGRWEHEGQRYFDGEVEPCINGRTVETGAYFGVDVAPLVERLLGERMADGGWNCEQENGSVRSSFDTTINVLDGLLDVRARHRRYAGRARGAARRRGVPALARAAPPREHRRRRGSGVPRRGLPLLLALRRAARARLLPRRRRATRPADGRGRRARALDASSPTAAGSSTAPTRARSSSTSRHVGEPSRWNTLRALRVLRWWDTAA